MSFLGDEPDTEYSLLLQRLLDLVRCRLVALRCDLRSFCRIFCPQHNRPFHQERDKASPVIGDQECPYSPFRVENIKDRTAQAVDRTAFFGAEIEVHIGDSVDRLLYGACNGVRGRRVAEIRLVVDRDHGNMAGADLPDDPLRDLNMLMAMRIGAVDHLYQKVCLGHLLEGRFKGLDKRGGKLMNKADRIG